MLICSVFLNVSLCNNSVSAGKHKFTCEKTEKQTWNFETVGWESSDGSHIRLRNLEKKTLAGFLHCSVGKIQKEAWDPQDCWCESQKGAAATGKLKTFLFLTDGVCSVWAGGVSSELIKWKTHKLWKTRFGELAAPSGGTVDCCFKRYLNSELINNSWNQ